MHRTRSTRTRLLRVWGRTMRQVRLTGVTHKGKTRIGNSGDVWNVVEGAVEALTPAPMGACRVNLFTYLSLKRQAKRRTRLAIRMLMHSGAIRRADRGIRYAMTPKELKKLLTSTQEAL